MYKQLLSDSFIYGFGSIVIKAIAFFTLPIYTRLFTPEEFGILEMFNTIAGMLSIFMTMGLDSAQSFYFMEAKNNGGRSITDITASIFQLRIIVGLIVVFLSIVFSYFIIKFTFQVSLPSYYLWIVAISTFFGTLVSQSLEVFRLIYKPWRYIALSFLQTVFGVAFILFFVYFYDGGIRGYLLGVCCGSLFTMVIGWHTSRSYTYWGKLDLELFKKFIKFGLPLLPSGLMIWIMSASDRWFVSNILGNYEVGIYAIGAKIALIITIVIETFRKAWWPIAMDMLHKDDSQVFFKSISLCYVAVGSLSAVLLTILSPYLVKILADDRYFHSWKLIGILCWGNIFYGFYLLSFIGIFKAKKTYISTYIYSISAFLNIILDYVLIKYYGVFGVALATSFSVLAANIMGVIVSNKYYKIDWQWFWYIFFIGSSWIFIFWYVGEK